MGFFFYCSAFMWLEMFSVSVKGEKYNEESDFRQVVYTLVSYDVNPYPTAFPYGNGMVLHFYQQQECSTTKTVHTVINKRLKTYV